MSGVIAGGRQYSGRCAIERSHAAASNPEFNGAVAVPVGFPGRALPVPRPGQNGLYLKLRDDPSIVNVAALVVEQPPSPPPAEVAPAAAPAAASAARPVTAANPASISNP